MAEWVKKSNPDIIVSTDRLRFGYEIFLNTSLTIIPVSIIGLILGRFGEVMVALIALIVFKFFSGGYHFKSSVLCILTSSTIILVSPYISDLATNYLSLLNNISMCIVLFLAPVNLEERIVVSKKYYWFFKLIALSIVLINTQLIQSSIMSVIFLVQSISLLPKLFEKKV